MEGTKEPVGTEELGETVHSGKMDKVALFKIYGAYHSTWLASVLGKEPHPPNMIMLWDYGVCFKYTSRLKKIESGINIIIDGGFVITIP